MRVLDHPLQADQARILCKALADPVRLTVIEALAGGERCVCDLTGELGLSQSKLSFHLKLLKEAGLLESRQQGRWIYYRLRVEALHSLQAWLAALAVRCERPASPCP
ncbi:MAG: metalloregulator ArsR/SmtB family transcription factor [Cyanobacteria bacterium]|nr:metalloregulator ArsR/SmtB family transcription factor [Cyanobacteriota bacterium]